MFTIIISTMFYSYTYAGGTWVFDISMNSWNSTLPRGCIWGGASDWDVRVWVHDILESRKYTVVVCAHTVVMCVVLQGEPLINMGPWKLFSSIVHSGCLCCEGGEALVNMGVLKLFSSSFLRESEPHSGSVYTHSGCWLCAQSSSVWPHSSYVCCFIARSPCIQL